MFNDVPNTPTMCVHCRIVTLIVDVKFSDFSPGECLFKVMNEDTALIFQNTVVGMLKVKEKTQICIVLVSSLLILKTSNTVFLA